MSSSDLSQTPDSRLNSLILPVLIIGAILVFIVPLPPFALDLLLAANITVAVLVLLTVLAVRTPQQFSAFPTILLATTLTRLVLNVASTRRILTHGGTDGLDAAGGVIRAFGDFVAGNHVVVGAILFGILIVIQFVVITKGATRISEVSARFALDGLPGRQMAIDADLHAGVIDQHQALERREAIYRQADFLGAMDGAAKFVRGDAVAGALITIVNIAGGLYMGVIEHGMPVGEAVDVFTKLTIGDGLVSQVPAFLISLAAGLIVTRSGAETDLNREVTDQLFGNAEVLAVAASFLGLLAFTSLPKVPLLTLAAALAAGAYLLRNNASERLANDDEQPATVPDNNGRVAPTAQDRTLDRSPAAESAASDRFEDWLQVDPLELEIGYRLIALADANRGDLLERIRRVRVDIARRMGLVLPQVRIRDQVNLGPYDYQFQIRGLVAGRGTALAGRLLAIPPASLLSRPDGRDGVDPVTGQPGVWIHADGREVAELAGCRILEASAVLANHFGEVILTNADELLSHEHVRLLLERTRATAPTLVDEVVPTRLRVGEVQRVLQKLVRERVSIRDLELILESLAEHAGDHRDPDWLAERVRQSLGRRLVQPYLDGEGRLPVVTLGAALDDELAADPHGPGGDAWPAEAARLLARRLGQAIESIAAAGATPVVLVSAEARSIVRDLTRAELPRAVILSTREVPRDIPIDVVATVAELNAAPQLSSVAR